MKIDRTFIHLFLLHSLLALRFQQQLNAVFWLFANFQWIYDKDNQTRKIKFLSIIQNSLSRFVEGNFFTTSSDGSKPLNEWSSVKLVPYQLFTILTLGISRRRAGKCPISFIIDAKRTGSSFRRNRNDCRASPSRAGWKTKEDILFSFIFIKGF